MNKYTITVTENHEDPDPAMPVQCCEVLRCGIDTFDLLTFVSALTTKPRGRPVKKPAREATP